MNNNETSRLYEPIKKHINSISAFMITFAKWLPLSLLTGIICGGAVCFFRYSIDKVTEMRYERHYLFYILPLAGLVIVFVYKLLRLENVDGTNFVIEAVRKDGKIPIRLSCGIFIGTVLTHLCGGSAGRAGAVLQIGGGISSSIGKIFRLDERDMRIIVLCGMSAGFSALFSIPLTAAIFVLEVVSVGVIYYSAFLPCVFSALTAYYTVSLFGFEKSSYIIKNVPELTPLSFIQTIGLGVLFALVSILICVSLKYIRIFLNKKIKNGYIRIAAGGVIVAVVTLFIGMDYSGASMDIPETAFLGGTVVPAAFLIKLFLTAVTIGCGFKGGEIAPSFFIGATFGCVAAPLLGLTSGFGAALGYVAVFCGVTNTPIAALMLSIEIFGPEQLPFFAIVCVTSYMLSGYFSLYNTQIIVHDKLKVKNINRITD